MPADGKRAVSLGAPAHIEFADVLDHLLQLLIFVEPRANLDDPFAMHAELLRATARVAPGSTDQP
jgi:hypothetical protein